MEGNDYVWFALQGAKAQCASYASTVYRNINGEFVSRYTHSGNFFIPGHSIWKPVQEEGFQPPEISERRGLNI
jgi:hypothetical protein